MNAETITLGGFLAGLAYCILTGTELLYALIFGMCCFSLYAWRSGVLPVNVLRMLLEGMGRVANIILIFVLIGSLTALWRVSGTIPYILYHSVGLIEPRYFVLCTFLLCCMMSFVTGTSFGTVSTMGVICMMISNAAGLNPLLTGGAVLSGIFFGDRCSPMSSSALLVCSLTKTDIYRNIRNMMRSSIVPFALSCMFYVVLAGGSVQAEPDTSVVALFQEHFCLHWVCALPAVLILALALLHINVKYAMLASILAAAAVAVTVQDVPFSQLFYAVWAGGQFEAGSRLDSLLSGGGIASMARVGVIVLISASYSGIFAHTRLLNGVKQKLKASAAVIRPAGTVTLTAVLSCMVSCNQSLATILTGQICDELYPEREELALALENTVIVIAALVPWSIAGSVPIAAIGTTPACLLYACYLYLLPLWNLFRPQKPFEFSKIGKNIVS